MTIDWPATAQMLTALTALGALIASPFLTFKVANKQANDANAAALLQSRTEVISKNRQDWINKLRDEVSEFCAEINVYTSPQMSQISGITHESLGIMTELISRLTRIRLLLNPLEPDHIKLESALMELFRAADKLENFQNWQQQAIDITRKILKEEWERVKTFT